MSPRAVGALLALVAALAFVIASASPAWWSGNPGIKGQTITAKRVEVSLVGARGCNVGGDGRCEDVPTSVGVRVLGYGVLALIIVAIALAGALGLSTWRGTERRASIATMMMMIAGAAVLAAIILVLAGPGLHTQSGDAVRVPVGWGVFVLVGAGGLAFASSMIARSLGPVASVPAGYGAPPYAPGPPPYGAPGVQPFGAPGSQPFGPPAGPGYAGPAPGPMPFGAPAGYSGSPYGGPPAGYPRPGTGEGAPPPSGGPSYPGGAAVPSLVGSSAQTSPDGPPTFGGHTAVPSLVASARPPTQPPVNVAMPRLGELPPDAGSLPPLPPAIGGRAVPQPPPIGSVGAGRSPTQPPPIGNVSAGRSPTQPPPIAGAPAGGRSRTQPPPAGARRSPTQPPGAWREPTPPPSLRADFPRSPAQARGDSPPRARPASVAPPRADVRAPVSPARGAARSPTVPPVKPPTVPPARAGTIPPPANTPRERPSSLQTELRGRLEPAPRSSTMAHTVPPPPSTDPDARRPSAASLDDGDGLTAVQTMVQPKASARSRRDSEGQTAIDSTELGVLDPRVVRDGTSTTSSPAPEGTSTSHSPAPHGDEGGDDTTIGAPPVEPRILGGEQRDLSTREQRAAHAATALSTAVVGEVERADATGSLDDADSVLPVTEAHDVPEHTEIAAEMRRLEQLGQPAVITTLPPPLDEQGDAGEPTPACPQCETPMTWVDEHLRFYCTQCRVYF